MVQVPRFGRLGAYDYFGDGSFFLLDAPGHAIGHICGLARTTTKPDTFILLGADSVHDGGELRPSEFIPIPETIDLRPYAPFSTTNFCCPGHVVEELQISRHRKPTEPILIPAIGCDIPLAIKTVEKLHHADAKDDIFFVYAHDGTILNTVDFFPKKANDWKAKGWAETVRWAFLKEYLPELRLE